MRFLLLGCLGLVLGLAPTAFGANAATALKNPAINENFYSVEIVDHQVWIVGYYGTILHSGDRGVTWQIQSSPVRHALFNVRFVTSARGWIGGSHGALLHTVDGGKNWRAQTAGTTEHLFASYWLSDTLGWMAGSRGTISRTNDGGRSWHNSSPPGDFTFSALSFASPTRGWVAGEFGVIFRTDDGGKSWSKQKSPVEVSFSSGESRNLFALIFPKPQTGFAFGLDGVVLKTLDGASWQIVRRRADAISPTGANHLFAAAQAYDRLWAVGERGTLLVANLDGQSWRSFNADIPRFSLNAIAFGKDGFGIVVGNRGVVLRTLDGGKTWQRVPITIKALEKDSTLAP
jgi:photosystem II stability/assembly factor-like uncharacterized protein